MLADHLVTAGQHKTALYTSKTIQNEIQLCGDSIRNSILEQVRATGSFSIMADEATDADNKEQLAICVRYINKSTHVMEDSLLGFSECVTGVTGEAISDRILKHLTD